MVIDGVLDCQNTPVHHILATSTSKPRIDMTILSVTNKQVLLKALLGVVLAAAACDAKH